MTIITIITLLLGGLSAYVYNLLRKYNEVKDLLANHEAKARTQEWSDKIVEQETKVQEDLRDYEKFKKILEDSNKTPGDTSGSDNPPASGAV